MEEYHSLELEHQSFESVSILITSDGFVCPICKEITHELSCTRRNTSYINESLNWLIACDDCHESDYEYFKELWNDYYRY